MWVILMKVADLATDVGYKNLPEPARALSIENKGATRSPATAIAAADDGGDRRKEATKAADKLSNLSNRRLKFEYLEEMDVFQVTVVDENDEVVRKIPADSILRVIENIERMLGLSIDTKA
jgi:uncharacterized FlaG/YvyC family protein